MHLDTWKAQLLVYSLAPHKFCNYGSNSVIYFVYLYIYKYIYIVKVMYRPEHVPKAGGYACWLLSTPMNSSATQGCWQFVEFNMQNVTFATSASHCVSHQGLANLLVVITSHTSSALCPRRVTSHDVRCHDSTWLPSSFSVILSLLSHFCCYWALLNLEDVPPHEPFSFEQGAIVFLQTWLDWHLTLC